MLNAIFASRLSPFYIKEGASKKQELSESNICCENESISWQASGVWDGKDDFGDKIGRGVYVYRVQVVTPEGQKAEQFEKLVILN